MDIKLIDLPKITDPRGNLTFAEAQAMVPINTWRTLDDFSSGAVCLVLASEHYEEDDYIYDYEEFLKYVGCR